MTLCAAWIRRVSDTEELVLATIAGSASGAGLGTPAPRSLRWNAAAMRGLGRLGSWITTGFGPFLSQMG